MEDNVKTRSVDRAVASNVAEQKYFGRVYTPQSIVDLILGRVLSTDLTSKKICDPACGTGDFLVPLVRAICRRIKDGEARHAHLSTLKNLTGYDVDAHAIERCRQRMNDVANEALGANFSEGDWRVFHHDALDVIDDRDSFDFVVGNPPYVRIQNLEESRRKQIRDGDWKYYRGSSDLYIVFYELGMKLLKRHGELIYISPSTWIRNNAGQAMREDIESNHALRRFVDFGDHQVFPGVSTYTCISHIVKCGKQSKVDVQKYVHGGFDATGFDLQFGDGGWRVVSGESGDRLKSRKSGRGYVELGSIADVHVGIQTLADKVFILQVDGFADDRVICRANGEKVILERDATRKILKASAMKNGMDAVERVVVYPYDRHGKLMAEKRFRSMYPLAYGWLRRNKERLLGRDKNAFDPRKWHGYGREVSIVTGFGEKILTSGMNQMPNFQYCGDRSALYYSGYCVKPHDGISAEKLLSELNSEAMAAYIQAVSQPFRGGWFSYAKKYIVKFPVSEDVRVDVGSGIANFASGMPPLPTSDDFVRPV